MWQWKDQLSIILTGFNSAIATKLYEWLTTTHKIPFAVALIASSLIAVLSQWIMGIALFELPLNFEYTRILLDPISKIEGFWLQEILDKEVKSHWSYMRIEYISKGRYRIYGSSFQDLTFKPRAYFDAITDDINLVGNEKSVKLYYSYTAKYVDPPKDILGSGILNFYSDGSSIFHRGGGHIFDKNKASFWRKNMDEISERTIVLTRITKQEIFDRFRKYDSLTNDDIRNLVINKSGAILRSREEESEKNA